MRPDNLAAQAKGEDLEGTLSEALDALIRQVRKRRAKLGRRWEQP
jgi:ribosome-associated translation inhibitor RaiA